MPCFKYSTEINAAKQSRIFTSVNTEADVENTAVNLHQIQFELENQKVSCVRSLYSAEEIEIVRNLLSSYSTLVEHGRNEDAVFNALDEKQHILELPHVSKLDTAFKETKVYQRSLKLASALFGSRCSHGYDHAIFKKPGSGAVKWHQDQFYSKGDLNKECLSFWIPLHDVSQSKGGMEYAIGTYEILPHMRISQDSKTHYISSDDLPNVTTTSPQMKTGDVCIHTPMTLHRSHPNDGANVRGAWILQFNRYGIRRFFTWKNLNQHVRRMVLG